MKKRTWWNPRLNIVSICIVMWFVHAVLKYILARTDVVSRMFAYGEQVPLWMALIAVIFVLIRLFVIIIIPGIIAWKAALAAYRIFSSGKKI
ncbi:hypothetical protein JW926_11970 [Candidatus Sumerlaeota bacterium]|nr:hypothetical protein [Candidatus Sumerlaeota bacterium]